MPAPPGALVPSSHPRTVRTRGGCFQAHFLQSVWQGPRPTPAASSSLPSGVASPTLFFLKIASAILGPWHFHVNCGILHQARWRLDWDGVESRVCGSVGRAPLPLISAHLLDSMFVLFHGPPPPIFSATSGSISWKFLSPPGLVKVMHTN